MSMYVDPPPFRMTDSPDVSVRLGRVESWVIRHAEWVRQAAETTETVIDNRREDTDALREDLAVVQAWVTQKKANDIAEKRATARLVALWATIGTLLVGILSRLLGIAS